MQALERRWLEKCSDQECYWLYGNLDAFFGSSTLDQRENPGHNSGVDIMEWMRGAEA